MANFYKDNADLQFYVEKGIDWSRVVELTERRFVDADGPKDLTEAKELYRDVMNLVGELAANEIAPHAAAIDAQGVHLGDDGEVVFPEQLDRIMAQIKELDLHGLAVPRELGGMNLPMLVYFLNSEMYRIPFVISPHTLGVSVSVVLLSALISGALVRRQLDRLDLIAVLKTRE